jgi:hypothetical protein
MVDITVHTSKTSKRIHLKQLRMTTAGTTSMIHMSGRSLSPKFKVSLVCNRIPGTGGYKLTTPMRIC